MVIKQIVIKNYKRLQCVEIDLNERHNIFVGENDAGKSTLLEALSIITTGKLNGYGFERQLKANMFNNDIRNEFIKSLKDQNTAIAPPKLVFEAYCSEKTMEYAGTNNSLKKNCPGICVVAEFNDEYSDIYKTMLLASEVYDIPVEFYKVSYRYFNGSIVSYRYCPFKAVFIDTTRKDYSYIVDRFVSDNITAYLSEKEQVDLSIAYRRSRHDFHNNDAVKKLNESVESHAIMNDRNIAIALREEDIDDWKKQMSVIVDTTPFENIGFGTQNIIKIELALKHSIDQVNMIIMEEPENNLTYTNMQKLLCRISLSPDKQIFVSTHSSFVANKLGLENLLLVHNGQVSPLHNLKTETIRYFKKLPSYDTLRLVLADKVILVEGPTDDLILQRAYLDAKGKLPSDDGIDIIVVDSLAFKRYCDIAIIIKKKVLVITDNDGSIEKNIMEKYREYISSGYVDFLYETDEHLNTIEPSVLAVNTNGETISSEFRKAISKNNSHIHTSKKDILSFMENNKSEWALRIFESEEKIMYPEYIQNAIKKFD
jgi:hypothetical protein